MTPSSSLSTISTSVRSDHTRTVSDMRRVVIAVHEHTMLLELAIAAEVFGVDRSDLSPNGEWYGLTAWTPDGAAAANGLVRRLVGPGHRPGGQAQFIAPPSAPRAPDGLAMALDWARGRLDRSLTVEDLARRAGLSSRQLARRMQAEIGMRPL